MSDTTNHFAEAERLIAAGDYPAAQVHATLALADAFRRVAADDDRIADCVPEGGSRFQTSGVRG